MKHIMSLSLVCLLLSACGGPVGNHNVPQPAKPVALERYMGQWYEIARYENRFEKGCEAVTASYSKREDGLVSVVNKCREGGVDGREKMADGKAKIVEGSNGSKLKVSFFGPFYVGDYWVLDRGENYDWSIVGEPSGRYLWILARKPDLSVKDKRKLYDRAQALGYDLSLLRETKH